MNKPICAECEVEFEMMESGVHVAELFNRNKDVYKLWNADLWKCPICDKGIVFGFGNKPLMEHFEGDLNAKVEELKKEGKKVVRNIELTGGSENGKKG